MLHTWPLSSTLYVNILSYLSCKVSQAEMNEKGVFLWMTAAAWQRVLSVCHLRPFTHRRQAVFFGRRRPLTCTAMKTEAIQMQELFTIMAIHLWMQHVSPITGSHYDSRRKIKSVLQQIIWTCMVKIINQLICWTNGSVFDDITKWHYTHNSAQTF